MISHLIGMYWGIRFNTLLLWCHAWPSPMAAIYYHFNFLSIAGISVIFYFSISVLLVCYKTLEYSLGMWTASCLLQRSGWENLPLGSLYIVHYTTMEGMNENYWFLLLSIVLLYSLSFSSLFLLCSEQYNLRSYSDWKKAIVSLGCVNRWYPMVILSMFLFS